MSSIAAHQCCITYQTMTDPVVDADGHTYEREAIVQWLRVNGTSPMTRRSMSIDELRPNRAVLNAISELREDSKEEEPKKQDLTEVSVEMKTDLNQSQLTVNVPDGPANPKKIVFVLDVSGSMSTAADPPGEQTGMTRLDVAKHAILTCIGALRAWDEASVVTFSNSAVVVFPMKPMTDGNKGLLKIELIKITDQGSTNIWDGIKTGFDQLTDFGTVFLMTDGCPNIVPPKGHMRMLRDYIDKRQNLDVVLHTFGFGYQLDADLLYEMAKETQGSYAFIPDIGMVGTVFVHRMANELVTYLDKAWLLIETKGSVDGVPDVEATSWGYSVPIGPICHGQPRHVFFAHSDDVQVTVKTSHWTKEASLKSGSLDSNDRQIVAAGILECWKSPNKEECIERVMNEITCPKLKKDMSGQITEAVEPNAFQKWGNKFLPSIGMTHWRQNCNNFLDPGVQGYGGDTFQQTRDHLDELFNNLKPPDPSRSSRSSHSSTRSHNFSMSSYNRSSGPCFTGDTLVQMADGTTVTCSDIQKGDMVATTKGPAEMRCIVKTPCNKANIVDYKGLQVTQWHPVKVKGTWSFPIYLGETKEVFDVDIFSFLLETGYEDMLMGDSVPCITLAHGIENDPVATHPFYGTNKVVEQMISMDGFEEGCVTVSNGVVVDVETNLVCGFNH
tara:strand:- start:4373 stop:6382 length:2010 start_codon:yes stop_codon:yes gene_type:complete